ncbi:MAG TPA: VWA domain-containing protein [Thermoanaerobaculaceae bacterium]|nr:VWA domain-containing protein [Thermoanaerobaculaceae bacterium]
MRTRVTLRVAVPFALAAVMVFAQQMPPTPAPTLEDKPAAAKAPMKQIGGLRFLDVSELTIVNVDVSVADKKGPVLGLTADDFEVFQDRKPVPLTNFAAFRRHTGTAPTPAPAPVATAAPPTPTPEPAPAPKREPRFIAFYVDNENLLPFDRNRVINKMVDWIETNLAPPDQAMVASYQRSLKILQPFTSDPEEIATALRSVKKFVGGRSDLISSRQRVEDTIGQSSNSGSSGSNYAQALDEARSFSREVRNNLQFAVRSLQDFVGTMSGLPGKKALIYLSDGLPMTPGAELFYAIQDAYQAPSVLSESREFDSTDLYDSLVRTAISAGVTLYSIDARGLQDESGIEAENRQARSPLAATIAASNYQDSLVYMASRTGGLAILNANDPTPGLEKIAADFETYYSLGYRLVPSGEDRMHRVEVKVKGHPDYKLVYKTSFIEKTLPTRIADRVVSGLAFDLQDNPLGIELSAGNPAPADNDRWTLPIEVKVPIDKIALIPDGGDLIGFLMVYYVARDDEGKQSDLQHTEHPIRIPSSDYQSMRRDQLTISTSLLIEPGTYRISVGVRDELTNQAGYALARSAVHPELK